MCGRYTLSSPGELVAEVFELSRSPELTPRYNVAPTQESAVIRIVAGDRRLDHLRWGLVPYWAAEPGIGNRMINARSETLGEKPSFRAAYRRRRCLVLADGFYEWVQQTGQPRKVPHYIMLRNGQPFAFAGLWEQWFSPDGSEIKSATIITTDPNEKLARLHNRMPVILQRDDYMRWIDPDERSPAELQDLLVAYPAAEMKFHPVSTLVNSPANNVPEVVQPV